MNEQHLNSLKQAGIDNASDGLLLEFMRNGTDSMIKEALRSAMKKRLYEVKELEDILIDIIDNQQEVPTHG